MSKKRKWKRDFSRELQERTSQWAERKWQTDARIQRI